MRQWFFRRISENPWISETRSLWRWLAIFLVNFPLFLSLSLSLSLSSSVTFPAEERMAPIPLLFMDHFVSERNRPRLISRPSENRANSGRFAREERLPPLSVSLSPRSRDDRSRVNRRNATATRIFQFPRVWVNFTSGNERGTGGGRRERERGRGWRSLPAYRSSSVIQRLVSFVVDPTKEILL